MGRFDVIVVGAGPAGCAAAYDLSAAGRSVLLFDRDSFPRHKVCAGGLTVKSLNLLRYDVQPVIRRICREMAIGHRWAEPVVARSANPVVAMTDRSEFDAFCLQKTIGRGAEFRVCRVIDGVTEREDHIELIVDGTPLISSFLVGADGAKSRIRRLIGEGSEWFRRGLGIETTVPWVGRDARPMQFDFGVVDRGYGWIFPKDDHLNVGLYSLARSTSVSRRSLMNYIEQRLGRGAVANILRGGALGLGGENYRPESRRIFLVGDAAGMVEPLTGEGIHNAIRSGQVAAAAIDEGSAGRTRAHEVFAQLLQAIQVDIAYYAGWEKRLHRHFDFWCRVLTSRPVRTLLTEGYAMGLTLSEIKNRWPAVLGGVLRRNDQ